jgi:hypothetical protein
MKRLEFIENAPEMWATIPQGSALLPAPQRIAFSLRPLSGAIITDADRVILATSVQAFTNLDARAPSQQHDNYASCR